MLAWSVQSVVVVQCNCPECLHFGVHFISMVTLDVTQLCGDLSYQECVLCVPPLEVWADCPDRLNFGLIYSERLRMCWVVFLRSCYTSQSLILFVSLMTLELTLELVACGCGLLQLAQAMVSIVHGLSHLPWFHSVGLDSLSCLLKIAPTHYPSSIPPSSILHRSEHATYMYTVHVFSCLYLYMYNICNVHTYTPSL